ncbi:hypothetical protein JVU11DRAFT_5026 [Chiua virens]|nr:hypothetical protein JVU11DRAFT_5026 [Chiua virens]
MNSNPGVNGTSPDHFVGHGHPLQPQQREHWPQMFPQNQPQQLHGSPWQQSQLPSTPAAIPQMQSQGYPNLLQYYQNQNSPQFDISSVVPQQIMQDFLRLSTPVGSSPNDDTILAQALHESKQTGKTYRQALEALHGVNNHAANLWKDYYLDHHDRIDLLVSRLAEQPKTVKKPVLPSKIPPRVKEPISNQVARKRYPSPPPPPVQYPSPPKILKKNARASGSSQPPRRKHVTPQPASTTTTSALARPPKRPRVTFNSLTAPLLSNDLPNLMPPQVHIPIPDPPSRSPTPPAIVRIGTHGNKYTKEDREYFIKFLTWRLKQDPSLTKKELCEKLHEKAPHHSVNSWASHWHQRHDIADKIFATYRESSEAGTNDDDDQQNEEEEVEVEEEMKQNDDDEAESEPMSANETSRSKKGMPRSERGFPDFGDPGVDTEEDEADMGEPRSSFTRGDWCTLARFIARNHWNEMTQKERWQMFCETYETKRNAKSWAEFYRKHEDGMVSVFVVHVLLVNKIVIAILKLSKRYAPGSSSANKDRREWSSGRNGRGIAQDLSLDEDGECETDYEDS